MDKNSVDWHGPCVALATPFDAAGEIDEAAFRENVELCLQNGVTGLLVSGCTGEFWALTKDERKRLYRLCVDAAAGRAPVIGGTGAIRTPDVIELTEAAKDAGCSGAMVLPPFFVKPSEGDIVAHYQAVSDAVEIPILLYNIPANAVNELTPELTARLADIDNVVAIKESSFDLNVFYRTIVLAGDRLRVFGMGLPGLLVGAWGSFGVNAQYWDSQACDFYFAYKQGDLERAMALHNKSDALRDAISAPDRNTYVAIKAAMNLFDRPGGYPRLPLRPLNDADMADMRARMERLGVRPPDRVRAAVAE